MSEGSKNVTHLHTHVYSMLSVQLSTSSFVHTCFTMCNSHHDKKKKKKIQKAKITSCVLLSSPLRHMEHMVWTGPGKEGEVLKKNETSLPSQHQYLTNKRHFHLHHKKEKCTIQKKATAFFTPSFSSPFSQLLYKLTSSCATNCLSLSRYCP